MSNMYEKIDAMFEELHGALPEQADFELSGLLGKLESMVLRITAKDVEQRVLSDALVEKQLQEGSIVIRGTRGISGLLVGEEFHMVRKS